MAKRQMLINHVADEECRIAIVEDGRIEEIYQERASAESHVGNIYKGRVANVEPSIQAAFIDFGLERNGFLHTSDLHPMYFPGDSKESHERIGKKTPRRSRPPIQQCLRRGQEILVQVLKEGIGTKGPTLTSYLSIPGRFLVMMPHMQRMGVSRKIEDDDVRREMRKLLDELSPPDGFGFIIRTAGIGRTKLDLKRDLTYLQRLWQAIERRMKSSRIGEVYTESDLVIRTIRDVFTTDIGQIIVDDPVAARRARDFLRIVNPRSSSKVVVYTDRIPLFHRFDIERQIENIHVHTVPLPSGGSLVIESTEALVAIDVNSGKMRDNADAETTAYKTNMEAADEICRQLRLRDLGGVIVNDLIDMRDPQHRRAIEQRYRENLKQDRARTRILPISQFGILEMTRQRMRPSLKQSIYGDCGHCDGTGHIKSRESVVLDIMRRLMVAMHHSEVARIELTVSPDVAFALLNRKRQQLVALEREFDTPVLVRVNSSGQIDYLELRAVDDRDGTVEAESIDQLGEPHLVSPDEVGDLPQPGFSPDAESADEPAQSEKPGGEDEAPRSTDQAPKQSKSRRRRRRRVGRSRSAQPDSTPASPAVAKDAPPGAGEPTTATAANATPANAEDQAKSGEQTRRPRRRQTRRRKTVQSANKVEVEQR